MEDLPLKQIVEGAILAAEQPLTIDQLMGLFEEGREPERAAIRDVLKEIEEDCEGRGYELKQVASGYRFQVRADYGEWVGRLWKEKPPRYSRALLETLALVAYKQPITRGDIEEIRGVAVSTNIMRTLIEREWVRVVGHRDVPGHPALYATTKNFLDYFNLRSLDELPTLAEIRDLTAGVEELEMEEELIEVKTLDLDQEEQEAVAGMDDADLDAVTEKVDNIQQNIRALFEPEPEPDFDEDLDDDDAAAVESAAAAPETTESESSAEPDPGPAAETESTESTESTETGSAAEPDTAEAEPPTATVTPISPEVADEQSSDPEGSDRTG
jgi:segregation and condensation protein B